MDRLEFAKLVDGARIYYKGKHVGTLAMNYYTFDKSVEHLPEDSVVGELYLCQNSCDGCVYPDKRGFIYTWYLADISRYFMDEFATNTIDRFLYEYIEDHDLRFSFDKIIGTKDLTLYDL